MFTTIRSVREARARARRRLAVRLVGCACAAFLTGGCSDDDTGATGTVVMRVGDSPYPFDMVTAAEITIDRVEVRVLGDDKSQSGFYVLSEMPRTLDLLELRGGVTELLTESEVPIGELDQIRLHVVRGGVTLSDGRSFNLEVPSGMASGLKVFCSPAVNVVGDLTTELLLDFDVSESFEAIPDAPRSASDIDNFHFHPVLRVANLAETGTLSGHVHGDAGTPANAADDPVIAGAEVRVSGVGGAAGTSTDSTGEWRIMGLAPGPYTVTASAVGYDAAQLTATVVVANDVTGQDFLLHQTSH